MSGWRRSVGNGPQPGAGAGWMCDVGGGQTGLEIFIPNVFFCFRWRCFVRLENIPSIGQENLLK